MSDEENKPKDDIETVADVPVDRPDDAEDIQEAASKAMAARMQGDNDLFRKMIERNFLDYAQYVIGSRAIPDVDDGMKPVHRRIMWTLYEAWDNGRLTKTANIVGNAMHYHPHGDQSVAGAVATLAQKGGCIQERSKAPASRKAPDSQKPKKGQKKESVQVDSEGYVVHYVDTPYFIAQGGNFGNVLIGTDPAAPRYTECALSRLAYETLFNNDITDFVPNYDGRRREPKVLPAKIPSLLLLGSDGIAVGISTSVPPHNFNELIDAEIAIIRGKPFVLYPDFRQGGLMDVSDYNDGEGTLLFRGRIDIDGRDIVIRELPAGTTTATIIDSIDKAAKKNKIRIASINDYTSDHVEIRVTPIRGYDPEKTRDGLFMNTLCQVRMSPKMWVICDRRPVQMSVSDILRRNVDKLMMYKMKEYEIQLENLYALRHAKTLAQLFFENRIYKRIEECRSHEEELDAVRTGLEPFRKWLSRDVTDQDIDKLLALPVSRIARFDIEKNERELQKIAEDIESVIYNLGHIAECTIKYLKEIKAKYGAMFPRLTEITELDDIDRRKTALRNIKIYWDKKNGYIGTAVKSDEFVVSNEFDRFVCVSKDGTFKIIQSPGSKMFVDKLYEFRVYNAADEFGIVYREKKSGKHYAKRSKIGGFILDREYSLAPAGSVLELMTPRPDAIYELVEEDKKGNSTSRELNLMEQPLRSAKARGLLVGDGKLVKITHSRYLTPEELVTYSTAEVQDDEDQEDDGDDVSEEPEEALVQVAGTPVMVRKSAVKSFPKSEPPVSEMLEHLEAVEPLPKSMPAVTPDDGTAKEGKAPVEDT
ncbi:MAG: hypothetical protein MJ025_06450, partial [Victivallaceae bacterium]|nr:hypothetical protein [Victivallaceae bacterium]